MTTEELNQKALDALENAVNNFGFNPTEFAKATTTWHRYLQGTLFKLAIAIIKVYGSEEYLYDGRNESAHLKAKEILDKVPYL